MWKFILKAFDFLLLFLQEKRNAREWIVTEVPCVSNFIPKSFTFTLCSTFASNHLDNLTESQLDQYDDIINRPSNDWQLYYWMTEKEEVPVCYDNEVMDMLKTHARNDKLEVRNQQPGLN